MSKHLNLMGFILFLLLLFGNCYPFTLVFSQSNTTNLDITTMRDPELEKKAAHNVEVAEFYLKKQKAYKASIERLLEIVEIYPQYSNFDKVLFLLGEAYVAARQSEKAKIQYNELIKKYPDSKYLKMAEKNLAKLK